MNLPEKLAREIRRVAELRCRYETIGKEQNIIVAPAMMLMETSLNEACKAFGANDILMQMAALEDLKGFER
jgi:hypothetical protein